MSDLPLTLFLGRAADYQTGRPGYPDEMLDRIAAETGFDRTWVIAELGSGTGILTDQLLKRGNRVFAVEPNDDMRRVAEEQLGACPGFSSVAARAETTALAAGSIDLIVSAQAFHHFDKSRLRAEFSRILRPQGCAFLCWNSFDTNAKAYQDFRGVQRAHALNPAGAVSRDFAVEQKLETFFSPEGMIRWSIPNCQCLSLEQLDGLIFSLSFMPPRSHPGAKALSQDIKTLFDRYAQDGVFVLSYRLDCFLWRQGMPVAEVPRL